MKEFKRKKLIRMPIYPFTISLCLLSKEGEKYIENKHKGSEARTEKEGQHIFIYFKEKPKLSTVVHELFHATEFIMEEIHQPLSDCPNETWAYLIEYLSEECFRFLKYK